MRLLFWFLAGLSLSTALCSAAPVLERLPQTTAMFKAGAQPGFGVDNGAGTPHPQAQPPLAPTELHQLLVTVLGAPGNTLRVAPTSYMLMPRLDLNVNDGYSTLVPPPTDYYELEFFGTARVFDGEASFSEDPNLLAEARIVISAPSLPAGQLLMVTVNVPYESPISPFQVVAYQSGQEMLPLTQFGSLTRLMFVLQLDANHYATASIASKSFWALTSIQITPVS